MARVIIDSNSDSSILDISKILCDYISIANKNNHNIIFLCIGTDRSTGDSLGPLVGENLKSLKLNNVHIYGDLENPVHSKNLHSILNQIETSHTNPYIFAIDASLGSISHVGSVVVEDTPLKPGSAMNKDLPSIGDVSITGVVNMSGALEFLLLQNTRLYVVMKLANLIANSIRHSLTYSNPNTLPQQI